MKNKLDAREANGEYFDLDEPEYDVPLRKWYVKILYDEMFFLHADGTIKSGTAVEFVPGKMDYTGLYDTRKEAKKVVKLYNRHWALYQSGVDIDTELRKELQGIL